MQWNDCKNILVIRADNMGDLIMTGPAIRALKRTFHCKITVLTSKAGSLITPFMKEVDEVLVYDLPWVKTNEQIDEKKFAAVIDMIKSLHFDAAVIFTVYSQNPLPAAMLAFMAGIPYRLAYCRENPYHLLTHWVPEKEPYSFIQHQVQRDLNLVAEVGAEIDDESLSLQFAASAKFSAFKKIAEFGFDQSKPYIILHPGVSEAKREYRKELWIETGKLLHQKYHYQILITGAASEKKLAEEIQKGINDAICAAGLLNIEEFIALINEASLVVSVNTGTVHIAAALQTPVVVLYATTNPQHTPWHSPSRILYFSVKEELKSRNEVVQYVSENVMQTNIPYPTPEEIAEAAEELLMNETKEHWKKDTAVQ